jgi:hypothetical protein
MTKDQKRLLAAAPGLLAACKAALAEHGKSVLFSARTLRMLETAIQEASPKTGCDEGG